MTFTDFLNKYNITLNSQQLQAVQSVEGPVLLLAVPGSGKTTVLVTRLGYMIYCKGIPAEKILTLTYTIAATRDMAERFEKYFGPELRDRLEFRTINGICAKIIAYYGQRIGKSTFTLVTDEKATVGMLSSIFQKVENTYPTESDIKGLRTLITYIKNMMLPPEQIQELEEEAECRIAEIYKIYCEEMRRQKWMDYDDQMIYALNILRRSPETLQYFQKQYPYICVDEAQDTSKIQHGIIALLAGGNGNLFMVGDEDQSIYGFRAAYPQALLSFEENHPGAKVLLMEENYRSNARIVSAADRFIQKNTLRHEKQMRAARPNGADIRTIELKGRRAQYAYLAKVAESCQTQVANPPRTAVLYRDNESVLPLIDRLERQGTPYYIRNAELTFFSHRVVLDILNIIRFAMNPRDTEIFMQIYYKINLYLNKQSAIEISQMSESRKVSVLEAAVRYHYLPGHIAGAVKATATHLENMLTEPADQAINRIVKFMGYGDYLKRAGISDAKIFILKAIASMEPSPESFLNRMAQLQQIIREKLNDPKCPFVLSTIHGSKGLEYDTVYLLDVADGIFPEKVPAQKKSAQKESAKKEPAKKESSKKGSVKKEPVNKASSKEWEAYEEERRIFYVGVTRAKDHLNLLQIPGTATFYRELTEDVRKITPEQRSEIQKGLPSGFSNQVLRQKKVFSQAEYDTFCESLGEGIGVIHKKFGWGVVAETTQDSVTIQFGDSSRKFSLRFLYESDMLRPE